MSRSTIPYDQRDRLGSDQSQGLLKPSAALRNKDLFYCSEEATSTKSVRVEHEEREQISGAKQQRNVEMSKSAEGLGRFGRLRKRLKVVAFGSTAVRRTPIELEPPTIDVDITDPCKRC